MSKLEQPVIVAEIPLGPETIRVELKTFNGRPLFSAWRFYTDKEGHLRPGKHGLACSVDNLPKLAAAFSDAVKRARAEGLLPS